MILLADVGSTKAHWALFDGSKIYKEWIGQGFNPNYQSTEKIKELILEVKEVFSKFPKAEEFLFFGSGVGSPESKELICSIASTIFPDLKKTEIHNDLIAAQKALFDEHEEGIIAILGTGSNAILYSDLELSSHSKSLGYFLGDEGGGTALGRTLLRDFTYGNIPKELEEHLKVKRDLNYQLIIDRLYKKEFPQQFLASFAKDLNPFLHLDYVQNIIRENFRSFINIHLKAIPSAEQYPIRFIGSLAYFYQDILKEELLKANLKFDFCIQDPVQSIIKKIQQHEIH
jgi:N-acetylglucosamine kinase-like BadF-type ATPase